MPHAYRNKAAYARCAHYELPSLSSGQSTYWSKADVPARVGQAFLPKFASFYDIFLYPVWYARCCYHIRKCFKVDSKQGGKQMWVRLTDWLSWVPLGAFLQKWVYTCRNGTTAAWRAHCASAKARTEMEPTYQLAWVKLPTLRYDLSIPCLVCLLLSLHWRTFQSEQKARQWANVTAIYWLIVLSASRGFRVRRILIKSASPALHAVSSISLSSFIARLGRMAKWRQSLSPVTVATTPFGTPRPKQAANRSTSFSIRCLIAV